MRRKTPLAVMLLLCFACFSRAQDAKGIWVGAFEADDVLAAMRLNFDEAKIVLSYTGAERSGAITNLKTANGEISFVAELRPEARFTGKFDGEKISGTFDVYRGAAKSGTGVWDARKVVAANFADEAKAAAISEKVALPNPAGKFAAGRKFFYWTDESRGETITDDAADRRKLFVQLWYPAKNAGKKTADYYPHLEELGGAQENIDVLRSIKTHAVQDAAIDGEKTKRPLIIFSPGLGTSPFFYTAIIENLVSRGYFVAAINHPYDSGDFKFSGAETIRYAAEKWDRQISKDYTAEERQRFFDERRFEWARDISFALDRLENLEPVFKNRIDWQNVGVLGHSFGGQAATIACASDIRFKACANLDGMAQGSVFLPDADGKILAQPFLFFNKSAEATDAELKMMNLTRPQYRERERRRLLEKWKPSFKTKMAQLASGAYFVLYPGIKHASFTDSWLFETNAKEATFAGRLAVMSNINDYIAAFFDKFLMKKAAPLLENKNVTRPPVIAEFLRTNKL